MERILAALINTIPTVSPEESRQVNTDQKIVINITTEVLRTQQ